MTPRLYMLDTDILVFVVRGLKSGRRTSAHADQARRILERIQSRSQEGDTVGVSAVTVAELEYGAAKSAAPVRERRALTRILAPFEVFDYDAVHVPRHYGNVRNQLEAQGPPIGSMDLMIAAHALALRATLVTNNVAEFARVQGLVVENWAV